MDSLINQKDSLIIISTLKIPQKRMSYLKQIAVDPHLQLLALSLMPQDENTLKTRVTCLTKTRRFKELLEDASKLENHLSYPNLEKQIKAREEQTAALKKTLGQESYEQTMKDLKEKSVSDEDNKAVDEGQMKIYKLAKIFYDQGQFAKANKVIYELEAHALKDPLWLQVTWALFYCEIALKKVSQSKKTAQRLKERLTTLDQELALDPKSKKKASVVQLQYAQKEELLNAIPFAFFSNPSDEDLEKFFEICTDRAYFSVIQLTCPHMLRYLCAAMLLNKVLQKSRVFDLFKLTEVINRGIVRYSDPLIDFVKSVYIHFDFETAGAKLRDLRADLQKDPFLAPLTDRIIENCQFLYYKVYCKVYESVEIEKIADFVGKTHEEAELWILKYIRSADIEAKIDATRGLVITIKDTEEESEKYIEAIPKMNNFINNLSRTAVLDDEQ